MFYRKQKEMKKKIFENKRNFIKTAARTCSVRFSQNISRHPIWNCCTQNTAFHTAVVAVAPLNYIIKSKIDVCVQVVVLEKRKHAGKCFNKSNGRTIVGIIINILPCGGFRGKLCVSFNFSALMYSLFSATPSQQMTLLFVFYFIFSHFAWESLSNRMDFSS